MKKLVFSLLLIPICFTVLFWYSKAPSIEDSSHLQSVYQIWKASPQDGAKWQALLQALQKFSFAKEKYSPKIAQELLYQKRCIEAKKIAAPALHSLYKTAPYHASYSETSFLVAEERYQEALEQAVHLNEELSILSSSHSLQSTGVLYGFNLLRIACLQNSLKNQAGELQALEELEQFLSKQDNSELSSRITSSFQEQGTKLSDYITYRKSLLQL